jgi:hypothetical protein
MALVPSFALNERDSGADQTVEYTIMKDSIHVSKENYLKAVLEAKAEGRQVIPAMLAHWLEVSAPAAQAA